MSGYGGEGDDEDEDSEDEEKYAMLRADIEDRQEGGFSERNRKVGPNDAEVRHLPLHSYFKIFAIKSNEKLYMEFSTIWMVVFFIEKVCCN